MGRLKQDRHAKSAGMRDYLRSIGHYGLLTPEDERALAESIVRGDAGARDRMVQANLRLVVRMAREFADGPLGLEDLVAEGNLGLIRAVERFDPRYGSRFSTYACHWIRQAMREAIAAARPVRVPAHVVQILREWRRAEDRLRRELCRPPSFDEVADALALDEGRKAMCRAALRAGRVSSGDEVFGDRPGPDEQAEEGLERAEDIDRIRGLLGRLREPERSVLKLRFGLDSDSPRTLREVGVELGLSWEWCRRLQARALSRLRGMSEPADGVRARPRLRVVGPAAGRSAGARGADYRPARTRPMSIA